MKDLLRIYRKEWAGLLTVTLVFILSFYLVVRAYAHYRENLHRLRLLKSSLQEAEGYLERFRLYDRYSFWRNLGPPQEVKIFEKVGLHPLREAILKLSDLYTERGFFFLEEFRLSTCADRKDKRRGSHRTGPCVPHLYVKGKKVIF